MGIKSSEQDIIAFLIVGLFYDGKIYQYTCSFGKVYLAEEKKEAKQVFQDLGIVTLVNLSRF
jgi:hypothetical protein